MANMLDDVDTVTAKCFSCQCSTLMRGPTNGKVLRLPQYDQVKIY